MSHTWAYVAAAVVLVALAGAAGIYYFGPSPTPAQTTPVTILVSGMAPGGATPISGVHVTAAYGGQSFTAVTNSLGQALFNIPVNTHVVLTDDMAGYKTIDTSSSSMFVPLFHE